MTKTDLFRIEDGKPILSLHPGQLEAFNSKARFTFVLAGTQGGKTSFGPWWLYEEIKRCGSGDYLAISSTYDLFELKLLPEFLKVFVNILGVGKYWGKTRTIEIMNPETRQFAGKTAEDPNMWARIILRSASAGKAAKKGSNISVSSLESATAKAALLDECGMDVFTREAFEAVLRRLSIHMGRILGLTTLYNHGWLKTDVYDKWKKGDPDYKIVQFRSIDNPAFPIEEYERARQSLPAWKFNMQYEGVYDRPAGMIFHDFNEDRCVIKPYALSPKFPRFIGIDPGAVNTASIYIAHDTDRGKYVIYAEYLEGNLTTAQHAKNMKERMSVSATSHYTITGGSTSEKQFRSDWNDNDIRVQEPPFSDVEAGLDIMISLMKVDGLEVFNTCVGFLGEVRSYSRELDAAGEPTEKIRDKDTYHRIDGCRYGLSQTRRGVGTISFMPPPQQTPGLEFGGWDDIPSL